MKYLLLAFALVFALPVLAAPPPAPLTAQDEADLQRAADYLNTVTRMKARILQLNPDGSVVNGTLHIKRPGRLRLEYDNTRSFIVADGNFVHYWDDSLGNTSSVPQGNSPAALILAAQVNFKNGMTITKVERAAGTLAITAYKTDDAGNGTLTLIFTENPMQLKQWRVRDAQGQDTTITLQSLDTEPQFDSKTFVYTPPNFGTQKR